MQKLNKSSNEATNPILYHVTIHNIGSIWWRLIWKPLQIS